MKTFRTPEEAIIEWKFAKDEQRKLLLAALKADEAALAATREVKEIADYLTTNHPHAEFDLGDGCVATVEPFGGIQLTKNPRNPPQNEPNS